MFAVVAMFNTAAAQDANVSSEMDNAIAEYIQSKTVPNAELGMLLCEDAEGNKVACSGAVEETVLGIVTSVPYVTVNKPANSNASKYVFSARISGEVAKGDYLKAVRGGALGKCGMDEMHLAYAVAIEDANGKGAIRVKVINR